MRAALRAAGTLRARKPQRLVGRQRFERCVALPRGASRGDAAQQLRRKNRATAVRPARRHGEHGYEDGDGRIARRAVLPRNALRAKRKGQIKRRCPARRTAPRATARQAAAKRRGTSAILAGLPAICRRPSAARGRGAPGGRAGRGWRPIASGRGPLAAENRRYFLRRALHRRGWLPAFAGAIHAGSAQMSCADRYWRWTCNGMSGSRIDFIAHLHARGCDDCSERSPIEGGPVRRNRRRQFAARTLPSAAQTIASSNEASHAAYLQTLRGTVKPRRHLRAGYDVRLNATDGATPPRQKRNNTIAADHAAQVREVRDAFLRCR